MLIGIQDVKSTLVYFYVQKTSPFTAKSSQVPFEVVVLNTGAAYDSNSGQFIAPTSGIYYFSFSGSPVNSIVSVSLRLNNEEVATTTTTVSTVTPITLSATLSLNASDTVALWLESGGLAGMHNKHVTYFSGFLLQEYLPINENYGPFNETNFKNLK